jgi:hypothetical protein
MLRLVLPCLVLGGVRAGQQWIAREASESRYAIDAFGCRQAATQFAFKPPKGVRAMREGGRLMPAPLIRVDGAMYDACLASRGYRPIPPRNL